MILANNVQVEQSLLLNYLSDLESYRSTHADLGHSTGGLLNLLLRFVKEIYTSSSALPSPSYQPTLPDGSVKEQQLVTMDQVKTQIKNVLRDEMFLGLLGPRPLWSFVDDPDPNPDMACYLVKVLIAEVKKLRALKTVASTPPPSESGESTSESNQPEFWRRGGNVMGPRFLDVMTAVEISAYSNDACSETTFDEVSSGTSFDSESEPSVETAGSVVGQIEMTASSQRKINTPGGAEQYTASHEGK